jgi:hypothetical protein
MASDDGYMALLRVGVVLWGILLDVQLELFVLRVGCCLGVFSDVSSVDDVFFDVEDG